MHVATIQWEDQSVFMVGQKEWHQSNIWWALHSNVRGFDGAIAGIWGSLVRIEEETLSLSSFERGRILIESELQPLINEMVEVDVAGKNFRVRVVEIAMSILFECQCDNIEY
ncbi:hypothetical protein V6N13_028442 [Hibiscus sabdariffa]